MSSTQNATSLNSDSFISGELIAQDQFPFAEADKLDFDLLMDVFAGKSTGVIFRSVIPEETCERIAQNFTSHPGRYDRGQDVPANYVGTFHYRKALEKYLDEVKSTEPTLDALFDNSRNVWDDFLQWFEPELARRSMRFRAAEFQGQKAARFVMRSWAANGKYSLQPHDDATQCHAPEQAGFEIQDAAHNPVVATNICIENGAGGSLHYWNVVPDDDCRERLGLMGTGHPYPIDLLQDFNKQVITINQGDVYCFNGKAIHAVETLQDRNEARSTISFLMAKRDQNTIIHWT